jgi:hypothetical protein
MLNTIEVQIIEDNETETVLLTDLLTDYVLIAAELGETES